MTRRFASNEIELSFDAETSTLIVWNPLKNSYDSVKLTPAGLITSASLLATATGIQATRSGSRWDTTDIGSLEAEEGTGNRSLSGVIQCELLVPFNYAAGRPFRIKITGGFSGEFLDGLDPDSQPGHHAIVVDVAHLSRTNAQTLIGEETITEVNYSDDDEIFTECLWVSPEEVALSPGDRLKVTVELRMSSHNVDAWGYGYLTYVEFSSN
jgi:hypothetical protein